MARRGIPKQVNWYLVEWMAAHGMEGRGAQAQMMKLTGWPKATMSQLYNGEQDYSPKIVNEAAAALNVRQWELLMHPEEAMAIRQLMVQAKKIAVIGDQIDAIPGKSGTGG